MMLGLGIGISLAAARAPGFDPVGLFSSGEIGWVEPMIPGVTLFQDAAGTIPVTAAGQPVGLSKFTAGGQLGFVQDTALNRPIYQVDVQGRGYLAHNGINQWMRTAAFAWGSDKATICAGVMRAAGTEGRILFELSYKVNSNPSSFSVSAPENDALSYASVARGSATSTLSQLAYIPSAPGAVADTSVITAMHSISGDMSTIRQNGVSGVDGTADKGAGNFGTYPLYAGSRAGTSLFFNGNRYPSMGINRLLTEAELAQVEAWVNQRTGAF